MRYLLDTNVISALRVPHKNFEVRDWSKTVDLRNQFISVFTVAEIERGVASKERQDSTQGRLLRAWFEEQVIPAFFGRVLPFDYEAARVLGSFRVPEHAPLDDALIAATAVSQKMVLVTRNVKHVEKLSGVTVFNPWS